MRRAIIVGASSGLGMEVARLLLNDGWHIGIAARRFDLLSELKRLCPERVEAVAIDVTSDDAPDLLLNLISRVGGIDLFFYSSGTGKQNIGLLPSIELKTVDTNALGFARMTGAAYRYFAEHGGGHIAAITSIAGTKGLGAAPAYSATKAFQNIYLQALEQQACISRLNVYFTDIRPGFVATPLLGDGCHYPFLMETEKVARKIVRAVYSRKHVVVIDWRWRVITALWRLIPGYLWRLIRVGG